MLVAAGNRTVAYGLFLMLVGVVGFLSNPLQAKTALLSGGTFGGLSILWGMLMKRGSAWAPRAAVATTLMLSVVFLWRASATWMKVLNGNPAKTFAAGLITAMLLASLALLPSLFRLNRSGSDPR